MHAHNTNPTDGFKYTLWDAKMYYNDLPNLKPALGGLNASAGAAGVTSQTGNDVRLDLYVGQVQNAWTNLQAGLTSVGTGLSYEAASEIAGLLGEVRNRMNEITDRLF
jgi:hypothetical protein